MAVEVKIPETGESVTEVVIARWLKSDGERVKIDESICVLESDKADFELPSPVSGIIHTLKKEGDTIQVGESIASIEETEETESIPPKKDTPVIDDAEKDDTSPGSDGSAHSLSPAVARLIEEHNLNPASIHGTGRGGRLTKTDVLDYLEKLPAGETKSPAAAPSAPVSRKTEPPEAPSVAATREQISEEKFTFDGNSTLVVPMSKIRRRIADRLVNAKQTTAMLTTFNEIDMSAVLDLRQKYKEHFDKVHGVSLGFMSFFARACVSVLSEFPVLNAKLENDAIIYHRYVHLGIAVSTERGLVVPVLKNVESMSFARVEIEIKRMSGAARMGRLSIAELSDGTFTITNGGIFGSLLSTPILNTPQTGILGMHTIKKRPVVINDQIEIRPMMYIALTYDHRVVDGRESVQFLVRLKEMLEDPTRLLLDI